MAPHEMWQSLHFTTPNIQQPPPLPKCIAKLIILQKNFPLLCFQVFCFPTHILNKDGTLIQLNNRTKPKREWIYLEKGVWSWQLVNEKLLSFVVKELNNLVRSEIRKIISSRTNEIKKEKRKENPKMKEKYMLFLLRETRSFLFKHEKRENILKTSYD